MSDLQVKGPQLVTRELSQDSDGANLLITDQESNVQTLAPLTYGVLRRAVVQDPKNKDRVRYQESTVVSQPDRVSSRVGDDTLGAVALVTKSRVPATTRAVGGLLTLEEEVLTKDGVNAEKTSTTVATWPELGRRGHGKLELIPAEFLSNLEVTVETTQVAYGTQPDALVAPLVESTVQDKTLTRAEKTNVSVNLDTVQELEGLVFTQQGQVASTDKLLVVDGTALWVDALTLDGSVVPLGNGLSVYQRTEAPSLFQAKQYVESAEDLTPTKFRSAVRSHQVTQIQTGNAGVPTMGAGDLTASEEQLTTFNKRVSRTTRDVLGLPVTLEGARVTGEGQVASVESTLASGAQELTADALTVDGSYEELGDGRTVLEVVKVDSVFAATRNSISVVDGVPQKFRIGLPISEVSGVSAGEAEMPTLGEGELSATEEQVTAFKKRVTRSGRDVTELPVDFKSWQVTAEGQVVEVHEVLDSGLQDVNPSEFTVRDEVENLGNGTSLHTYGFVPSVFGQQSYQTQIVDGTPQKFRFALPIKTDEITSAGAAESRALATGELVHQEQQVTEFKFRTTSTYRDELTLPVSLTGYRVGANKKLETVVETLASGLQTVTPTGLMTEGSVENLGNGTSVKTVATLGSLFAQNAFTKEVVDLLPTKFRAAIPTLRTESTVAGSAGVPTLASGDLSASEEQVDAFNKRVSTTNRGDLEYPVVMTGYRVTQDKQVATRVETLDSGLQSVSATALTVSGSVDDLGNGTSLKSVESVGSLFTQQRYTKEIPDVVPPRFRVAVPTVSNSVLSTGTAISPTLATGDLSAVQEQVDAFNKKTTTTSRAAVTLPVSLTSYRFTPNKQVETYVETLDAGVQTITPTGLTVEAQVENLGDGTSLKGVGTVASLFGGTTYERVTPDVVPLKFRATLTELTHESIVSGNAVAPTLGKNDIRATQQQVDAFNRRTSVTTRDAVAEFPIDFQSWGVTNEGQVVEVHEILSDSLQDVSPSELTVEDSVENLGNGQSVRRNSNVSEVFGQNVFGKQIPDAVPLKFRVAVPILQEEVTVAGDAASPTLGSGDLSRSESQVTKFKKRTSRSYRNVTTLPVSLSSYRITPEGQVETVVETLATGLQTVTPSALLIDGGVENLGNGTSVKSEGSVPSVFSEISYSASVDDVIPLKFRTGIPLTTVTETLPGNASGPTLTASYVRVTDTQVTKFRHRVESVVRDTGPIEGEDVLSYVSLRMTQDGQVETITETLAKAEQTITATALTVEAQVEQLGGGVTLKTDGEVPSVFPQRRYVAQREDLTPAVFRATIPTTSTSETVSGSASAPTLSGGQLSVVTQQVGLFKVRTEVETRDEPELPVSVVQYRYAQDGQIATETQVLDSGLQTVTSDEKTVDASVLNLGNGRSVSTVVAVPALAALPSLQSSYNPGGAQRFVTGTTRSVSEANVAATDFDGEGDFETRNVNVVRTRAESVNQTFAGPLTGYGYSATNDGALVTAVEGRGNNSSIASSLLLLDADTRVEGGELTYRNVNATLWPTVTSSYYNERGDLVSRVEKNLEPGDAVALAFETLTSQKIGQTDTRARKRVDSVSEYKTLTSHRLNSLGLIETITDDMVDPTVEPEAGFTVVSDEVKAINETRSNRVKVVLDETSLTGFALVEKTTEPETRVVIVTTRKQTPYTQTLNVSALHESHLEPIDKSRAWYVDSVLSSIPATYTETKYIEYTFPALVTEIATQEIMAIDGSGDAILTTNPIGRPAFTKLVPARVTVEFASSLPTPAEAYQLITNNLVYDGLFYRIDERNVLNDDIVVTYTYNNPKWGTGTEEATFAASTPNASGYVLGTEVCLGSTSRKWKFGLYRTETFYIHLQ